MTAVHDMCPPALIVLMALAAVCAGATAESPQGAAPVKARRHIDHERPLIVLYMAAGSGTMVERHWAAIPDAPKTRCWAGKPRIECDGAVYHVMSRGDRGGKI